MNQTHQYEDTLSASMLLLTALMLLFATGCFPTYSPPVRTGHYGAPAAPKTGQLEVGGAFYGNGASGGGAAVDYAVSDHVQLEAGADALNDTLVMGFLGVRYSPINHLFKDKPVQLTLDIEGGGGAGVGGEHCWESGYDAMGGEEECDGVDWWHRAAGGGYLGLGLGFKVAWFDLFVRGRLQLTKAESAPLTLWSTALSGAQVTMAKRAKLYVGGGFARYDNDIDSQYGFLFESGLSFLFDTMPARPQSPAPPAGMGSPGLEAREGE